VTVKDWIASRKPPAPPVLMQQILELLGEDAEQSEEGAADICLAAGARALEGLLSERRFGRQDATELLAIDALATYAFEHASSSARSLDELQRLTDQGTHIFSRLAGRV
jgi:hypothetical protein